MTPVQRRRLAWVLLALLASGLATALVAMALERNIATCTRLRKCCAVMSMRSRASAWAAWW